MDSRTDRVKQENVNNVDYVSCGSARSKRHSVSPRSPSSSSYLILYHSSFVSSLILSDLYLLQLLLVPLSHIVVGILLEPSRLHQYQLQLQLPLPLSLSLLYILISRGETLESGGYYIPLRDPADVSTLPNDAGASLHPSRRQPLHPSITIPGFR